MVESPFTFTPGRLGDLAVDLAEAIRATGMTVEDFAAGLRAASAASYVPDMLEAGTIGTIPAGCDYQVVAAAGVDMGLSLRRAGWTEIWRDCEMVRWLDPCNPPENETVLW